MVNRFEGPDDMRATWNKAQDFEFLWEGSSELTPSRERIMTHTIRWNYGVRYSEILELQC